MGEIWQNREPWKADGGWPMTYSIVGTEEGRPMVREVVRWVGQATKYEDLAMYPPFAIPVVPSRAATATATAATMHEAVFKLRWAVRDVRELLDGNREDPANEVQGLLKQGEDLARDLSALGRAQ